MIYQFGLLLHRVISQPNQHTLNTWKKNVSSSTYLDSISNKVFKGLWQLKNSPPRVVIFIWRCLHNVIVVKGNLAKFINSLDPLCPFCEKETKTVDHLFFNCEFLQSIWFGSPLGLRTRGNKKSFQEWIGDWCSLLPDTYALSLGSRNLGLSEKLGMKKFSIIIIS